MGDSLKSVKKVRVIMLLNDLGIRDLKEDLVYNATGGRTTSLRESSDEEVELMLDSLISRSPISKRKEAEDRMRKRILSICYNLGWTKYNSLKSRLVVDMDRLNDWIMKYGYLHKPLDEYDYTELPLLVTQAEKLLRTTLTSKKS